MGFLYGIATATAAIIAAETLFDYSLGDVMRDFAVRVFRGAEAKVIAQQKRIEARLANIKSTL